ncbi:MAG TPA: DNA repair protein RadA [Nitrospinota bacterium]|nr:DNA repair protein RadA [Nitrospinota bacterium]
MKNSISFVCQACGYKTSKWMGKCPSCNQWESFSEEMQLPAPSTARKRWTPSSTTGDPTPITTTHLGVSERISSGIGELDHTLGGGIVSGSFILVGGDPGIGKSTLLLQVAGFIAKKALTLYVTGEESPGQIKMRGDRLGILSENILVLPETQVELIEQHVIKIKPTLVIIDSIQTIFTDQLPSAPGTVGQVRESAGRLLSLCKASGIPMILIGHVTKDGAIAGPRLLEHMVDTVLYFEGENGSPFRILRSVKNRFGSSNEIGVFEMKSEGLCEVNNASELFLSGRAGNVSGSVVAACISGNRPFLVEIQALVSSTHFPSPRRTTSGVDPNRLAILMAIVEKRCGYQLASEDIFVNAAGGTRIDEPAVDLAIIASVVSSFRDINIDPFTVILGEVGLGGEIRSIPQIDKRIAEASKLGFNKVVLPKAKKGINKADNIELVEVSNVMEALEELVGS